MLHGGGNVTGRIINQALQFVFILLVSRQIGVSEFGIFSLLLVVFNIGALLAKLGIDKGILRFIGIYRAEKLKHDGRITSTIRVALLLTFLAGCAYFFAVGILGKDVIAGNVFSMPAVSAGLPLILLGLPFAMVVEVLCKSGIALGDILPQFLFRNITVPLLRIAGMSAVIFWGLPKIAGSAAAVYSGGMIAGAVLVCLYFIVAKKDLVKTPAAKIDWKAFLGFSIPSLTLGVTIMVFNFADMTMLGILSNTEEVGLFSAGKNLAFNLSVISYAFVVIFSPIAAGFFSREDLPGLRRTYRLMTTLNVVLNMPLFILLATFPRVFLGILGPGFTSASTAVILLAVCYFLNSCMLHGQYAVLMAGYAKTSLAYHAVALAVNIVLNGLLIPTYGSNGAAVATLIAILLVNLMFTVKIYRLASVNPFPKRMWSIAAIALAMFTVFKGLDYLVPVTLPVGILLAVFSYLLVIPLFFRLEPSAAEFIKPLVKRFKIQDSIADKRGLG